ncbi:MAG TPA: hypothetical protein VEX60_02915 [Pyrinomonadaceae bacterium]|nr:hypothetical protein [Pyrinomonadaceae bacterium]
MDSASELLRSLLMRLPTLLLFAAGVVFAIIRWKRHPKVSLLTLLGLCIWQIESFAFMFVRNRLPDWLRENGWDSESTITAYFAINLTQDFFYSIMLILLVAAALSQRGNRLSTSS